MIRRRYGDATYQGTSLLEVAGLIAEDGDFDFTALANRKLEQLYAAGGWHQASRARQPGIERLRELIKAGELPYVAHVGLGIGGLMILDTGQVVSFARDKELLDMVISASKRDGEKFKLSRLPVQHQRRIKRESSSRWASNLMWVWGYLKSTVIRSSRPHTFSDGRQEMPTCGHMLPVHGWGRQFHPFFNRIGLGTEMPMRGDEIGLSNFMDRVVDFCVLRTSQGLGELAVLVQVEGDVMTLRQMNQHNLLAARKSPHKDAALVLAADVSKRTGRSPLLGRLRREYGDEDEVDP